MIAQVEGQHPMMRSEALGDRCPVAAGAEQSVQDRQRRAFAIFDGGERNGHGASGIRPMGRH